MSNQPAVSPEPILEPDLPIIDCHHHLHLIPDPPEEVTPDTLFGKAMTPIARRHRRYLLEDLLADMAMGHNFIGSVFAESHAFYRSSGPEAMKPVGEIEFAAGVAAMTESGTFGSIKLCNAITGYANLQLGDAVQEVLEAQLAAGGGRFRGVRATAVYDDDESIFGPGLTPGILRDPQLHDGVKCLEKLDLSFEATIFEPQLPELIDLARAFPEVQIVLSHVGFPMGLGRYAGTREERFPIWKEKIQQLADAGNTAVKLGGMGMAIGGFDCFAADPPASSEQIAAEWGPYIQTCIEVFGADRCMFESNFPEDAGSGPYPVLWNAFKRIAAGCSSDEKSMLFAGSARQIYRLTI